MISCLLFLRLVFFLTTTTSCIASTAARDKFVLNRALGPTNSKVRRYTYNRPSGVNYEEATILLQKHNEYRRMRNASDMLFMEWNNDIQYNSQAYADKCVYKHSEQSYRKNVGGFDVLGENLFVQNLDFELSLPVQLWYDEVTDYNYDTTRCNQGKVCGHYTQVVWASSYALGCGITYCKNLKNARRIPSGYYVVCQYGPAGNYLFRKPYALGKPCSKCKEDTPYCTRGLCSKFPQIGSSANLGPNSGSVLMSLTALSVIFSWFP